MFREIPPDTDFSRKCAALLVQENKYEEIHALIIALRKEDDDIALISSDILFEISRIKPSLLENDVVFLIEICKTNKNKLYKNCLKILIILIPTKHEEIFIGLFEIIDIYFEADDDLKNLFIELFVSLIITSNKYYNEICFALRTILECSPSDYIVTYAEKMLPILDKVNCKDFQRILVIRKKELNPAGQKAIERILLAKVFN